MSKGSVVTRKAKAPEGNDPAAVEAFLAKLQHPHKAELVILRRLLLAADPRITEGIKWNSPSFYFQGWFATMNLRAKSGLQLILHLGAKVRPGVDVRRALADPAGLLEWLGPDRASVQLRDADDLRTRGAALQEVVRQWIGQLVE